MLNPDVVEGSDIFQFMFKGDLADYEPNDKIIQHLYKVTGLPDGTIKDIIWTSQYRLVSLVPISLDSFFDVHSMLGPILGWLINLVWGESLWSAMQLTCIAQQVPR